MKTWDTIRKGTKIILEKDSVFNGFDGEYVLIAGKYYICGFWANVCGLSTKNSSQNDVEYHIPAIQLRKFKGII